MTTVAVMQPYFVPYAGYFRLFEAADVVVMFDCVQFPRRGWVHRNRLRDASGELEWFTLPIAKASYDARIDELRFAPEANAHLTESMRRFPALVDPPLPDEPLLESIRAPQTADVTVYLCDLLAEVCRRLGYEPTIVRSSALGIAPELRAQARVIAIARAMGASRYLNPPGGRDLYDSIAFAEAGMELTFLTEYAGDTTSILERLLTEPADAIRAEITAQTRLVS